MEKKKVLKKAAALSYDGAGGAPKITALGKGEIAEKIIQTARQNNIPVFENSSLIETLINLDLGTEIPPELYSVVAEILVFISEVDVNHRQKIRKVTNEQS